MKLYLLLLGLAGLAMLSLTAEAQNGQSALHLKKDQDEEKGVIREPPAPLLPFKRYRQRPLTLPDSLGGDKYSVVICINICLDSNGRYLFVHPVGISLFKKGTLHRRGSYREYKEDRLATYHSDAHWQGKDWHRINIPVEKYLDWLRYIIPKTYRYQRIRTRPPPGRRFFPVMDKNDITFYESLE